mgnify:CR=1 FL=1
MIDGKTIIGIVPARGGSKRLPGKNLRLFHGKQLINWTIESARQSRFIDKLVVSTEDEAIIQAVSDKGVEIVNRPQELADDKSSVYDAIFHVLAQYEPFDYTVLLQVTSPLRTVEDIDGSIHHCWASNAPSCITITQGRPDANGAVYVAWTTWLKEQLLFDGGRTVVYPMPQERSVDINSIQDFERAEQLMSFRLYGRSLEPRQSSMRR